MDNLNMNIKTTPKFILSLVEEELDIPNLAIKNRSREITQARAIYYKLARKFCSYATLKKIGEAVNKDHATVVNGLKTYDIEAHHDGYMNDVYEKIYAKLDKTEMIPSHKQVVDLKLDHLSKKIKELEQKLFEQKQYV